VERDAVGVIEVIIAELLHGVRTAQERAAVLDLAGGTRSARVDRDTWIQSGDLGRLWRSRGRTLSLIDCMIATVAMRDGHELWTLDNDFAPIAAEGSLVRFVPG
jgi:predicted nucleic acid-binding protein